MYFLDHKNIKESYDRIKDYVIRTPIITDKNLNQELGANIFFKTENLQKTGSFKIRGACNDLLQYYEKYQKFPDKVTTATSGNHGAAIAYLSRLFNIKQTEIYIDKDASPIKILNSQKYQADVIITNNKRESNLLSQQKSKDNEFYLCDSFAGDNIILGQGTACYEAINQISEDIDAIFAPCGGGGLISGTYLASQFLDKTAKVFAVEPENANDALLTRQNNKIFQFDKTPDSIADGARTLAISQTTFPYIKKLDDIYLGSESEIKFWYKKLNDILSIKVEPTSALSMIGAEKYIKSLMSIKECSNKRQNILVIISGGNI
jgi:threonine dehydratase